MTTTTTRQDLPLEAARQRLAAALAARSAPGHAPRVVTLGARAAKDDPYAETRPDALVHLTSRAVLVGPWGGDDDARACGTCLAMRWQRLRSRTERDALETGTPVTLAPQWPALPGFL
ncbi:MAG TPA: cyclodehydratase, partial [Streptomyces sp.]|nr:cyclodehydratase [Streptomyces sp.]